MHQGNVHFWSQQHLLADWSTANPQLIFFKIKWFNVSPKKNAVSLNTLFELHIVFWGLLSLTTFFLPLNLLLIQYCEQLHFWQWPFLDSCQVKGLSWFNWIDYYRSHESTSPQFSGNIQELAQNELNSFCSGSDEQNRTFQWVYQWYDVILKFLIKCLFF